MYTVNMLFVIISVLLHGVSGQSSTSTPTAATSTSTTTATTIKGVVEATQASLNESNSALFGSTLEKAVKRQSAMTEPAWQNAGTTFGLEIWRIVKLKVKVWPKEDYGNFYNGDSYIILNTYSKNGSTAKHYDIHYWIGNGSTLDETITVAYKAAELDRYLNDSATQNREEQGSESDLFKSYFTKILYLSWKFGCSRSSVIIFSRTVGEYEPRLYEGGADSGLRKAHPTVYKKHLYRFYTNHNVVQMVEVPLSRHELNINDVFVLDLGLEIYQLNGRHSSKYEKLKAAVLVMKLKSERDGKPRIEVIDESNSTEHHKFYTYLTATVTSTTRSTITSKLPSTAFP